LPTPFSNETVLRRDGGGIEKTAEYDTIR